jgi:hypothetical protein
MMFAVSIHQINLLSLPHFGSAFLHEQGGGRNDEMMMICTYTEPRVQGQWTGVWGKLRKDMYNPFSLIFKKCWSHSSMSCPVSG